MNNNNFWSLTSKISTHPFSISLLIKPCILRKIGQSLPNIFSILMSFCELAMDLWSWDITDDCYCSLYSHSSVQTGECMDLFKMELITLIYYYIWHICNFSYRRMNWTLWFGIHNMDICDYYSTNQTHMLYKLHGYSDK